MIMKERKAERIFWGIFLIAAAVILVINKMGLFEGMQIGFWQMFFAAICLIVGIKSIIKLNMTGILFSVAFILIIFAEKLGIAALSPWTILLAATLLSIGFTMIFGKKHRKERKKWYEEKDFITHDEDYKENFDTIDQMVDEVFDCDVSFGSSIKYINSDNFKRGDFRCNVGALKVYFDNAHIENEAVLNVDVRFSGVELYIPKEWDVIINVSDSFSGIEEKNRNASSGTPVLKIEGDISFSGMTIIYV